MNLQEVKDTINKAGFSPEGLDFLNLILDRAIVRGSFEKQEKTQILQVMDIEIKSARIVAEAKEKVAAALNNYADGIDNALTKVSREIEEFDKNLAGAQ